MEPKIVRNGDNYDGATFPIMLPLRFLGEQVVVEKIRHAARPGFVGIAANVHAFNERHLIVCDVSHIDVDIQDKIGNFLHRHPCHLIGPQLFAELRLTTTALPDGLPTRDLRSDVICQRSDHIFS